ncbi:MAG: MarR family transcriptional regulator [Parvibaculum sp.]
MKSRTREFATRLLLVSRLWRRQADEAVGPYGLTEATTLVLVQLLRLGEGMRQNALAAHLGIEGPSLVRQIDALEEAGVLERRPDPEDRRAKALYLTPRGRRQVATIEPLIAEIRQNLLAEVSAEEMETCFSVFAKIEAAARRRGEQV